MASTNKTSHYELSQFVGSDKPAWLGDYNSDMSKIDAGINTAQTTATGADGKADTATTNIGNLENLTTTTKSSLVSAINEVDGHADGAQETANVANTNATSAISSLQNLETYLNLSNINTYTNESVQAITSTTGSMRASSITVATNSTGSLAKVYGTIRHKPNTTGNQNIFINYDTGLRPSTDITITPVGEFYGSNSSFNQANMPVEVSLVIKTTGFIEIRYYAEFVPSNFYYGFLFPSLLFVQDWGDAPTPA